jgi:hypothetical protein
MTSSKLVQSQFIAVLFIILNVIGILHITLSNYQVNIDIRITWIIFSTLISSLLTSISLLIGVWLKKRILLLFYLAIHVSLCTKFYFFLLNSTIF